MARLKSLKIKLDFSGKVLPNLELVLQKALPAKTRTLLSKIVKEAEKESLPIYLVGGFVRDLFLGQPSLDLDLVLEGDAIRFGNKLAQLFGGRLVPHKTFGTAVWWLPTGGPLAFIDLISARREHYAQPAALPQVVRAEIMADQFRRDFTINTLALGLNGLQAGRVLDPWGGRRDLKAGVLRTLHKLSFVDDPTRILRILRFASRLGFRIEAATQRQLKAALPKLALLSGERVRAELELVLKEKKRADILRSMQRLGVLRHVHPKLNFPAAAAALLDKADFENLRAKWELEEVPPADIGLVCWLFFFSSLDVDRISARLQFTASLQEAALAAAKLHSERNALQKLPISRLVLGLEKAPLLSIYVLFLSSKSNAFGKKLEKYASTWRYIYPLTNGNDLKKKGLRPGPAYKEILAQLRAARLDGEVHTSKQEAALLEQLLDEKR